MYNGEHRAHSDDPAILHRLVDEDIVARLGGHICPADVEAAALALCARSLGDRREAPVYAILLAGKVSLVECDPIPVGDHRTLGHVKHDESILTHPPGLEEEDYLWREPPNVRQNPEPSTHSLVVTDSRLHVDRVIFRLDDKLWVGVTDLRVLSLMHVPENPVAPGWGALTGALPHWAELVRPRSILVRRREGDGHLQEVVQARRPSVSFELLQPQLVTQQQTLVLFLAHQFDHLIEPSVFQSEVEVAKYHQDVVVHHLHGRLEAGVLEYLRLKYVPYLPRPPRVVLGVRTQVAVGETHGEVAELEADARGAFNAQPPSESRSRTAHFRIRDVEQELSSDEDHDHDAQHPAGRKPHVALRDEVAAEQLHRVVAADDGGQSLRDTLVSFL